MSDNETSTKPESTLSTEAFKQLHETSRHAFGLYVTWFTFFITLNFIALGWLARVGTEKPDPLVVKKIALALVLFIVLGIVSGVTVVIHAWKTRAQVAARLASTQNSEYIVCASLPAHLYTTNICLMGIALVALLCIWVDFL